MSITDVNVLMINQKKRLLGYRLGKRYMSVNPVPIYFE